MTVEAAEFRRVLGHWATGVSIVAAHPPDGQPSGFTANAFCSVSLVPPLVLVCVAKDADTHNCIADAGAFAVSVLASDQERLARRFAACESMEKFQGVAHHAEQTGAPVLDDAIAWVDCRTWATHDAGDHTVYIGQVVAAGAREHSPLLYYRGGYGRFAP
ncbi:MAG: flavin reductase family protein [Longimicrobiales bacterium]